MIASCGRKGGKTLIKHLGKHAKCCVGSVRAVWLRWGTSLVPRQRSETSSALKAGAPSLSFFPFFSFFLPPSLPPLLSVRAAVLRQSALWPVRNLSPRGCRRECRNARAAFDSRWAVTAASAPCSQSQSLQEAFHSHIPSKKCWEMPPVSIWGGSTAPAMPRDSPDGSWGCSAPPGSNHAAPASCKKRNEIHSSLPQDNES